MKSDVRAVHWGVTWGFLLVVAASIGGLFVITLWRAKPAPLAVYGQLSDFKLTNQLGGSVSLADLQGQVWVADIIFTRCPGPCLEMTRSMKAIQDGMPAGGKLLSLTADPAYDTPAILKQYGARFKADATAWMFLTGPKAEVYRLAMNGLKLAVQENPDGKVDEDQFIHSTRLVLIDRHGRLRGIAFDGTDANAVPNVLAAVRQLLTESGS